jgi:hypothetical protein|nr:MAG TPA_asm: protein of unknown function (DUF5320) [Bacteriophage sp.]DAV61215.1 MAG TPA: protein of unknown function (DUF5320) [Caudoviricetes sp.]
MPYIPYGYQPGYYGQAMPDQLAQLRQNAYQPPTMPGQATQQATPSIIWVPNAQAAEGYLVAPNSAVVLWDSSAPVVYLKQTDASGKPNMKTYDLVERTSIPQVQPTTQEPDRITALKSEVERLKSELGELKEKLLSFDKSEK